MELSEAIKKRRSVRGFNNIPVEFDKITEILTAGLYAPSSGNLQNWQFIVVTDKEKIRKLPDYCAGQEWISQAPVVIIVCAETEEIKHRFGKRGTNLYSIQNTALAIQNILLTAEQLELSVGWIGAFDEQDIKKLFDIPDSIDVHAILGIGYSDYEPPEKIVLPLERKIFFNSYGMIIRHVESYLKDYHAYIKPIIQKINEKANKTIKRNNSKIKEFIKDKYERFKRNIETITKK